MGIERHAIVRELDVELADGRFLHAYDTGSGNDAGLTVIWHHGTPNVGVPPAPLFAASERLRIRWVSYDRPGYGGSTRHTGRDVASAAHDVASVADALRVDRFAVMGHSGGGPHALACAASLPERVVGAISVSGPAPHGADGLDWFGGMAPSVAASLRAALAGREAKERHEASAPDDPDMFIGADHAALQAEWSWFLPVVSAALAGGRGGLIDDDLAAVAPWGFEPRQIAAPTLLLHGRRDRVIPSSHGEWLAQRIAGSELHVTPDDGHISVLQSAASALEWLRDRAA